MGINENENCKSIKNMKKKNNQSNKNKLKRNNNNTNIHKIIASYKVLVKNRTKNFEKSIKWHSKEFLSNSEVINTQ
ncbi:hypothetical protein U3516DRAFT_741706 [Neocallimastix sp. 'constans']